MAVVTERTIQTNGVRLFTREAGGSGDPLVVLAHGFPELSYSWRHQIPALAAAGYHVLAPDQRGYGRSSRPAEVNQYDIVALTGDLIGLLDDVGVDRAVFIGHDWGSIVTWMVPLLHPDRVRAVAGLSGPPAPRPRTPPTEVWRRKFSGMFFYMLYFQEPGVADVNLGRDPATTLRRIFCATTPQGSRAAAMSRPGPDGYVERLPEAEGVPEWLSEAELGHYIEEFSRTGFTGALNWYRNFDRNWHLTQHTPAATISVPSLSIIGAQDPVLTFTRTDRFAEVVSGPYEELIIDGGGHWIQQERPEQINETLLRWLSGVFGR